MACLFHNSLGLLLLEVLGLAFLTLWTRLISDITGSGFVFLTGEKEKFKNSKKLEIWKKK
jgi:hypothetical protein